MIRQNVNKKIFFASDVHLGHPSVAEGRERELIFANWLDSIKDEVAELYLVGDIFDFWHEYKWVAPRGYTRILGRIASLTDAGIPVHFFTGNHDVWVYDYLPQETGVILHRGPFETELLGKKFYIAHGDGLGPGDLGYKLLKWGFTNKVLQWFFSRLHPNFAFGLAHAWSNKSRHSKGIVAEQFNGEDKELSYMHAKTVLESKYFDYFVFGHRHLMVNQNVGETSKYILLGDWLHNFSYGVFDGDTFELKKVSL